MRMTRILRMLKQRSDRVIARRLTSLRHALGVHAATTRNRRNQSSMILRGESLEVRRVLSASGLFTTPGFESDPTDSSGCDELLDSPGEQTPVVGLDPGDVLTELPGQTSDDAAAGAGGADTQTLSASFGDGILANTNLLRAPGDYESMPVVTGDFILTDAADPSMGPSSDDNAAGSNDNVPGELVPAVPVIDSTPLTPLGSKQSDDTLANAGGPTATAKTRDETLAHESTTTTVSGPVQVSAIADGDSAAWHSTSPSIHREQSAFWHHVQRRAITERTFAASSWSGFTGTGTDVEWPFLIALTVDEGAFGNASVADVEVVSGHTSLSAGFAISDHANASAFGWLTRIWTNSSPGSNNGLALIDGSGSSGAQLMPVAVPQVANSQAAQSDASVRRVTATARRLRDDHRQVLVGDVQEWTARRDDDLPQQPVTETWRRDLKHVLNPRAPPHRARDPELRIVVVNAPASLLMRLRYSIAPRGPSLATAEMQSPECLSCSGPRVSSVANNLTLAC